MSNNLFGYALVVAGRDALYLPMSTKPQDVGYDRNITLNQTPGTESTFTTGDGQRVITPLILTGTFPPKMFSPRTEDAARLVLTAFDEAASLATGIQRGQNLTRSLWPGGSIKFAPGSTPLVWTFTLTLYPNGPSWVDSTTGRSVPF